jgi:formamidopyrimidine-DNA glycosylase
MPEGPECKRVSDGLLESTKNKTLIKIEILGGRFLKKSPVGLDTLNLPSKVIGGGVKGKFIWLELANEMTLWITLGMSGFWSRLKIPHAHLSLILDDGTILYFIDQRRFGTFKIAHKAELDKKLKTLGIDPLNDPLSTVADMVEQLRRVPNKTIVEALMDQRLFAGIGNYIKCEMLYRARVNPLALVKDLTGSEIALLWSYCKFIMEASYSQGGASIRNYQDVNSKKGEYTFSFEVYAQKTDSFGNTVERFETPDGRTTHWVPAIQL